MQQERGEAASPAWRAWREGGTETGMGRHLKGTGQLQPQTEPRAGRDNKMLFVLTPKSVGESFSQEMARKEGQVFGYRV